MNRESINPVANGGSKIEERFPYLTGFAWVNMIFGASLALIVLAFVALIVGPLWDILLAMIFLTAAREFRQPGDRTHLAR